MASLKDSANVATVGIEMVLAVTIGLFAGQALDEALGTGPWMTIFLVGVGFGAAVKAIARTIRTVKRELEKEQLKGGARPLRVTRYERRWS